jgi:hypothetical protein
MLMMTEGLKVFAGGDAERVAALERFGHTYQATKAALLTAVVARRLSIDATNALLDA